MDQPGADPWGQVKLLGIPLGFIATAVGAFFATREKVDRGVRKARDAEDESRVAQRARVDDANNDALTAQAKVVAMLMEQLEAANNRAERLQRERDEWEGIARAHNRDWHKARDVVNDRLTQVGMSVALPPIPELPASEALDDSGK